MKKNVLLLLLLLPLHSLSAATFNLVEQRHLFSYAEKQLKHSSRSQLNSQLQQLDEYPLVVYLEYNWLKRHLTATRQIKDFLNKYPDTRYAWLLKAKWQVQLTKERRWSEIVQYYSPTKNIRSQCRYYHALYQTGEIDTALLEAKKLWIIGKSQPNDCNPIFKKLQQSHYFNSELRWTRFRAAMAKGRVKLATYIKGLMSKRDQTIAKHWFSVHKNPKLIHQIKSNQAQAGLIFAHGIQRLARKNLANAIDIWDAKQYQFDIDATAHQQTAQKLAMSLVFRRKDDAYSRLSQLSNPTDSAREWRVRAALRSQNWQAVDDSIQALDEAQKSTDKWQYWQARAFEQTNQVEQAHTIYNTLSANRSFYGYLSANKLHQDYQLSDIPIHRSASEISELKSRLNFRIIEELIAIKKPLEAKRNWWFALKKLSKEDILTASKYAQQLGWTQEAIFTIAKAKYWDDVSLRFPMAYKSQVLKNAKKQTLNPAVIYGLIRRESAFNQNAYSPVGARGLMQIMPKTGQEIARELGEKWTGKQQLFDPERNIRFGAYYYKKLLKRFNGHYALAAAAYNAGGHRVKKWRPKTHMEADVWVETIPFKETRAYVSAVMTYALIYQKQLNQDNLNMNNLMKVVSP